MLNFWCCGTSTFLLNYIYVLLIQAILVFHKKKWADECLNRKDNRFLHRVLRFAIANTPYFYSNELKFSDFKRT